MSTTLIASSVLLAACGGGGGGDSTPKVVSGTCQTITGCVEIANGFKFPDGTGGTITCTAGACVDDNEKIVDPDTAYKSGVTDGTASQTAANDAQTKANYNKGYTDGGNVLDQAKYDSGYAAGKIAGQNSVNSQVNSNYNDGYSDGKQDQTDANYDRGYQDGYNSSYNSAYNSNYNSGYTDGYNYGDAQYTSGYNSGYDSGYDKGYSDGSSGYSVIGATKDTDLQKAKTQKSAGEARARAISQQFGMSVDSARKISDLSDQVRQMALAGQMTAADRAAITKSALKIAGVTPAQVNTAMSSAMKGNMKPVNDVMEAAAKNMGMASGADLRDKLLPTFGLALP